MFSPLSHRYTWWDLYNVSDWVHAMGHDVFIFSMPLKGINLGPGTTDTKLNDNHCKIHDQLVYNMT